MIARYLDYVIDTDTGLITGPSGRVLHGSRTQDGYLYTTRKKFGHLSLHRMVWSAAHGPIRPGMEINHINGIKTDNRLANLECVTRPENIQHAFRLGLYDKRGERHPGHKLTAEEVRAIRRLRGTGSTLRSIGEQFGVSLQTVHDIAARKSWRHLDEVA